MKLAFTVQPTDAVAGQAIAPAVKVAIEDASSGAVITTATNAVTLSLAGATLYGTRTVNAVNGVATFASLKVNKPGVGYTFAASSAGTSGATSQPFTISSSAHVPDTSWPDLAAARLGTTVGSQMIVRVADLDGDGLPDVITTNRFANSASIWKGVGHGSIGSRADIFSGVDLESDLQVVDIDGDGLVDLVVSLRNSNQIGVCLQDKNNPGQFLAPNTFAAGQTPQFFAVADMNGDGLLDLVVPNEVSGSVSVLLQDPSNHGSFLAPMTMTSGSTSYTVAVGDFDGDGKLDFVVANYGANTISVFLQDPAHAGAFLAPTSYAAGTHPNKVDVADLNGDGLLDVVVTNLDSASLSVFFQDPAHRGKFLAATTIAVGAQPHWVLATDIDGDGRADLLVTNYTDGNVAILHQNAAPAGSFSLAAKYPVDHPYRITLGDLDGDGRADLVVASYDSNQLTVFMHDVSHPGTFLTAQNIATGSIPRWVKAVDVNGDGKLDLIVSNQTSNSISVLLADATTPRKFNLAQTLGTSSNVSLFQVVDLDRDGRPDIVAPLLGGQVVVWLADPANPGQFLPGTSYAAGSGPHQVVACDLDGDGWLDLAVADSNAATVSVLRQDSTHPGTFLAAQSFSTGSSGGTYFVQAGDVNGDGRPDLVAGLIGGGANAVSVLLADPAHPGSFLAPTQLTINSNCLGLELVDLDGDGKLDIAACNGTPQVSVFKGHGDGTFDAKVDFATGNNPSNTHAVDVNGDGKLDLIVASWAAPGNDVEVYVQDPAHPFTFVKGPCYHADGQPTVDEFADLDGDGFRDDIATNYATGDISILWGRPARSSSFAAPQPLTTGSATRWIGAVDLNGDGKRDLVVTNAHSNTISVLLQDHANPGSFPTKVDYATPGNPCLAAIADLNGDGLPDVVTANQAGGNVSVFLQDPAHPGTFLARTDYAVGPNCSAVAIADFDHDGRPDLAIAVTDSNQVAILRQDPAHVGKFLAPTMFSVASTPQSLAAGDLNGDGRPDLVVACSGANVVDLLLADPAHPGSFLAATAAPVGSYPLYVAIADLNRDGKLDVVVANRFGNTVSILPGAGNGTFGARVDVACGTEPWSLAVADVNGDGRPDVVVANATSNDLVVLAQDANG